MRVALGLVAVVLASASAPAAWAHTHARRLAPAVRTTLTPKGWVPLAFGNGQVSVPPTWLAYRWGGDVGIFGIPVASTGLVRITGPGTPADEEAGPGDFGTNSVFLSQLQTNATSFPPWTTKAPTNLRVNGFVVERSAVSGSTYDVPKLGLGLYLSGPLADRVLHTLTYSPRAVALRRGAPPVPRSWRRITFDGLQAGVPKQWSVLNGFAKPVTEADPSCSGEVLPVFWFSQVSVRLSSGYSPTSSSCRVSPRWAFVARPVDGLLIDGDVSDLTPVGIPLAPCLRIHGLSVCPSTDAADVFIAEVRIPGKAPVDVGIGLAGSGEIAEQVLESLAPSK